MEKGFSVIVKDSDGVKVTMTFDLNAMSDAERTAFLKFHSVGRQEALTQEEKDLLASKKTYMQGGSGVNFCCRFDWHFSEV